MTEHVIPELDRKGLREFGLVTGAIVAALFGLFFPWLLERSLPLWPWIIFGVLAFLGLAAPMALNPVYKTWMRFGLIMSKIMTPLIMGIVFYIVITPVGLFRKIFATDSLARTFDETDSYRVPSKKAPVENLEKPY
jgi:Saxitoxin biosynthesis operon protein SxtJ